MRWVFFEKTQGLGLTVENHCSSKKMDKSGSERVGVKHKKAHNKSGSGKVGVETQKGP